MYRFASRLTVGGFVFSPIVTREQTRHRSVTVDAAQLEKLQEDLILMQATVKSLLGGTTTTTSSGSGTDPDRARLLQLGYVDSDLIRSDNGTRTFLKPSVWSALSPEDRNKVLESGPPRDFSWQKEVLLKQGFGADDIVCNFGKYSLNKELWNTLSESQQEELREKLGLKPKQRSQQQQPQEKREPGAPPSPEEAERRKAILRKLGFKEYDIHPVFGGLTPFKFKSLNREEQKAVLEAMQTRRDHRNTGGAERIEFGRSAPPPNVAQDVDDDDDDDVTPAQTPAKKSGSGVFDWEKEFLEERGIKGNQLTQNSAGGWWFTEEVLQGEMSRARVATWKKRMTDYAAKNSKTCSSVNDDEEL